MKRIVFISLCLVFASANAQSPQEEMGIDFMLNKNYLQALPIYKTLAKNSPDNAEFRYKYGLCLVNTYGNLTEAIANLEFAAEKNKTNSDYWFYLGLACQHNINFDKAITAFEHCKQTASKKDLEKIERQIENCLHGKELTAYPVNVTFQNLGKNINSVYPDYYPLVPDDESFLLYTTRRPLKPAAKPEMDGYFSSDIYTATPKDGAWINSKNIGVTINTLLDEQAVDISGDGKLMTLYMDHIDSAGNLYLSENTKTGFRRPERTDAKINEGFETAGAMNANEDVMVFASERKGGTGGKDIYIIRKLCNGHWATPEHLGNNVNTKFNEDFPRLSKDGKTLFFASEGHSSMGGFDIFKSEWNETQMSWSAPQNLGYPINDAFDNENITFSADGSHAYISAIREGGMGDLDLYKIKFNEAEPHYCIITGYIKTSDSVAANIKIKILVSGAEDNLSASAGTTPKPITDVLKFAPVQKTGKYVMALPPGSYKLNIVAEGYEEVIVPYTIFEVPFQPERTKDFILQRKK
ncbi:MAG: PD40 domain-containing protein [Bacteroidia bacterium]|nr:PD40 domain-containing protein [Bacteroidia bacterium]